MPKRRPRGHGGPVTPPTPPPDPPPDSTIYGYGENVTGGTGGSTEVIDCDAGTAASRGAAFLALEGDTGTRTISITGSGNIDLGGEDVRFTHGDLTIEGDDWTDGAFQNGWILLKGEGSGMDNVWLRNLACWTGEDVDQPADADGFTVNGNDAPVTNVLFDHMSMIFGPDIGGLAIFGDVSEVSILRSIIGVGLFKSTHPEASRSGGHAKGFNITQIGSDTSQPFANHISVFLNMIGFASDRTPQLHGGEYLDFANNVHYNWGKRPPDGNPRGLNFERNVVKVGPETTANRYVFLKDLNTTNPTPHPNSIWLGSSAPAGTNKAVGFAPNANLAAGTKRTTPFGGGIYNYADIIDAVGSTGVEDAVEEQAGHSHRRTLEQTLLTHMVNGTSDGFYSGDSGPALHPSWP